MSPSLSPAKVVLLAVHYAAHSDVDTLTRIVSRSKAILHKELLLRILLTHLPEIVKPRTYVPLLKALISNDFGEDDGLELDVSPVSDLSDDEASKNAKKLHLLQLSCANAPTNVHDDPISTFLFQRSYNMESETGLVAQIPELLEPFLSYSPAIRSWLTSTVLPYLRKNFEYHSEDLSSCSLLEFQQLSPRDAIFYLLSQTGRRPDDIRFVGRDLKGLIGPWLHCKARWLKRTAKDDLSIAVEAGPDIYCPDWEQVLEWLVSQATNSWKVAVAAVEQWNGPQDMYSEEENPVSFDGPQRSYLVHSYARAALASVYLVLDGPAEALPSAYKMTSKIKEILGYGPSRQVLDVTVTTLPHFSSFDASLYSGIKTASFMRNDLLETKNLLTSPTEAAVNILSGLILSAIICAQLGLPRSVRKVGDLFFLRDPREQRAELVKLIRSASDQPLSDDDSYWSQVRRQLLWLYHWGPAEGSHVVRSTGIGLLGTLSRDLIETEILKALLARSRCFLARSIYEDGENPLPAETVQGVVHFCALSAFDNAPNPNRSLGGLKKCDEIIHAFPKALDVSHPSRKQVEALLKCTHALGEYRLVLKQGEPFSPVVLRVHSDPVSIITKVLEQNLKAYTRLQEFLELAINMVQAGIVHQPGSYQLHSMPIDEGENILIAEKRIVAMCIEGALREDDFETAYSYVVSRLEAASADESQSILEAHDDNWSWSAALRAGQYVRTRRTLQPTHLGTASGNLEIRHLEQRIECLATALRVAPPSQLQGILKSFRRCEEQLDSAIRDEADGDVAWNESTSVPGAFRSPTPSTSQPTRNMTAAIAARQGEYAPMSIFDLSRATARVAQRNFTKLSGLPGVSAIGALSADPVSPKQYDAQHQHRTRKRDQFREAATGTLVSGVGWLIGANVNRSGADS